MVLMESIYPQICLHHHTFVVAFFVEEGVDHGRPAPLPFGPLDARQF